MRGGSEAMCNRDVTRGPQAPEPSWVIMIIREFMQCIDCLISPHALTRFFPTFEAVAHVFISLK